MLYKDKGIVLSISTVESESGITRDVLRKWEARYGFPTPSRNKRNERVYKLEQVSRLRVIKRLIDVGVRPSKIVPESAGDLAALSKQIQVRVTEGEGSIIEAKILDYLRDHNLIDLRWYLQHLLLKQGLYKFVLDTVAPLTFAVGEAWSRNELEVYEEHMYAEIIQEILHTAADKLANDNEGTPRILLTTPPGETHTLGIMMALNLFMLEGAHCIYLGAQTPFNNIASAVLATHVDIVALSFSSSYPRKHVAPVLSKLQTILPERVTIWAGGDGVFHLLGKITKGATIIPTLEGVREAFLEWREIRTV